MQIWAIEEGEDYEGGRIVGLYFQKEDARADFIAKAESLNSRFGGKGIDEANQGEDGGLYLHAGCDWLTLTPMEVKGDAMQAIAEQKALPAGR